MFGDASLFAEFDKERAPCDAILLTKFEQNEKETPPRKVAVKSNVNGGDSASDESSNSAEESDDDDSWVSDEDMQGNQLSDEFKSSAIKRELQQLKQKYILDMLIVCIKLIFRWFSVVIVVGFGTFTWLLWVSIEDMI